LPLIWAGEALVPAGEVGGEVVKIGRSTAYAALAAT